MKVLEHRPPDYPQLRETDPLLFPIGPITCAPDWQADTIEIIRSMPDEDYLLHVANPRRQGRFLKADHDEQVDWEEFYILTAARHFHHRQKGGILVWFAQQDSEPSRPPEGWSYAETTKREVAELFGLMRSMDHNPPRIVIGFEKGYKGGMHQHDITRRAESLGIPVLKKLELACEAIVEMISDDVYRKQR